MSRRDVAVGNDRGRPSPAVKQQVRDALRASRAELDRCPETGRPHRFTPDLEYDSTGETINCEDCGELAPEGFEPDEEK